MKIKFKGDNPAPLKVSFLPSSKRAAQRRPSKAFEEYLLSERADESFFKVGDKVVVKGLQAGEVYVINNVSCDLKVPRINWAQAIKKQEAIEKEEISAEAFKLQVTGSFECTFSEEDYRRLERKALEAEQAEKQSEHWLGAILYTGKHFFDSSETVKKMSAAINALGIKKRTKRGE